MATHVPSRPTSSPVEFITVTISTAADGLSGSVDLTGHVLVGVQMSTAWTAAGITFAAATTDAGTYQAVYGSTGDELTLTTDASRYVNLSPLTSVSYRHLKVRSGTNSVPVAQAATRTLQLVVRPFQ